MLRVNPEKGIEPHPYTELLLSFPSVSENIACTRIRVIWDIDRFHTYKEFKKNLGVSAEIFRLILLAELNRNHVYQLVLEELRNHPCCY